MQRGSEMESCDEKDSKTDDKWAQPNFRKNARDCCGPNCPAAAPGLLSSSRAPLFSHAHPHARACVRKSV